MIDIIAKPIFNGYIQKLPKVSRISHKIYQLLDTSQDVASSLKSSWSLIRFTTEMLCMVYLKLELTLNLCQSFWMIGMAKIFAMFLRFALAPNRSLNNCSCSRL
jgi:hypothetical protein